MVMNELDNLFFNGYSRKRYLFPKGYFSLFKDVAHFNTNSFKIQCIKSSIFCKHMRLLYKPISRYRNQESLTKIYDGKIDP
jgi:hypothetical protein